MLGFFLDLLWVAKKLCKIYVKFDFTHFSGDLDYLYHFDGPCLNFCWFEYRKHKCTCTLSERDRGEDPKVPLRPSLTQSRQGCSAGLVCTLTYEQTFLFYFIVITLDPSYSSQTDLSAAAAHPDKEFEKEKYRKDPYVQGITKIMIKLSYLLIRFNRNQSGPFSWSYVYAVDTLRHAAHHVPGLHRFHRYQCD